VTEKVTSPSFYTLQVNDREESLRAARKFADTSYADALDRSTKNLQYQLAVQRNQFAARGILRSGNMLHATAQLYGKHIDDMAMAKLEGLLEGYELHDLPLDEQLAGSVIAEVVNHMGALLVEAAQTVTDIDRGGIFTPDQFAEQVRIACKVSRNSVTVHTERKRLKPKEANAMNIIYQVSGYGRVNVNSTDNSTNVVTISQDQIFAKLRHEITTQVPSGDEQRNILDRLSALEKAQNSPTFAERYTDLISVAANHMTLLAPFLPALTEMMRNWLGK
jgi:hypothetical protein